MKSLKHLKKRFNLDFLNIITKESLRTRKINKVRRLNETGTAIPLKLLSRKNIWSQATMALF